MNGKVWVLRHKGTGDIAGISPSGRPFPAKEPKDMATFHNLKDVLYVKREFPDLEPAQVEVSVKVG
jgi:hypothetical protein